MKLFINEKNSWGAEELEILNENEEVCYTAKGNSAQARKLINLYDANEQEIGIIRKNHLGLISQFYVEVYDQLFGNIDIVATTIFTLKYNVDLFGWTVKRNYLDTKYSLYKDNELIASFTRRQKGANSQYEIDLVDSSAKIPVILYILSLHTVSAYSCNKNIAAM